ncbi:PREDICTED: 3-mercaptopyruvate sulfurtransferase-like [Priapulus caudatus]|uniref:Sulfurtransferase n=1 Tax=Priapulus caudatus TaxID=37621 RepID=A0ABM1E0S0_PRICU|nr:PREDICTED: 3-mercaptopyruvate sulfurtransferase-like [Priapulus caudatus]
MVLWCSARYASKGRAAVGVLLKQTFDSTRGSTTRPATQKLYFSLTRIQSSYYSSSTEPAKTLLSVNELKSLLESDKKIRLLECGPNLSIKELYDEAHIGGSTFFNVGACSELKNELCLKYMLPDPALFSDYVEQLGVSNDSHVVVCERHDKGFFYAPRVWWMFRVFGHDQVSILSGGLGKWLAAGNALTRATTHVQRGNFRAEYRPELVRSYNDIEKLVIDGSLSKSVQLVDARSQGRFEGWEQVPGEAVGAGHVPGSISLHYAAFMDPFTKTMRSEDDLEKILKFKGVDLNKPIVATCGQGITACFISLAAFLLGKKDVPVYDGSWNEWFVRAKKEHIQELE